MYLTVIFLFLIACFSLFPIFVSRRTNFRYFLSFVVSFILTLLLKYTKIFISLEKKISLGLYDMFKTSFLVDFVDKNECLKWLRVNNIVFVFIAIFIICYFLSSFIIRKKSYFRENENKFIDQISKWILVFFNITIFSFTILILLTNLNTILELKEGFLNRLFDLGRRVILHI